MKTSVALVCLVALACSLLATAAEFWGSIEGVVRVNRNPIQAAGSVEVLGDALGTDYGHGVAAAWAEAGDGERGNPVHAWPAVGFGFVVPNSYANEWPILTGLNDSASFQVDINRGDHILYDIHVVSVEPLVYAIHVDGDLSGEPGTLVLPCERVLRMVFHEDGSISGDASTSGHLLNSDPFHASGEISGRFQALAPGVTLPAQVFGHLTIDTFDSATLEWTGRGSRVVSPAGDLNCDGIVNNQDIDHFVQALLDPAGYVAAQKGACDLALADFTGDGRVDGQDINGFVAALFCD